MDLEESHPDEYKRKADWKEICKSVRGMIMGIK